MIATTAETNVQERVLAVIEDVLALENGPPPVNSSLVNEVGVDSLDLLSLFMELEDEFGDTISVEDAEKLDTTQDIIDCIATRIADTNVANNLNAVN